MHEDSRVAATGRLTVRHGETPGPPDDASWTSESAFHCSSRHWRADRPAIMTSPGLPLLAALAVASNSAVFSKPCFYIGKACMMR